MGSDRSSKRDRDHDSSKSSSRRKAEDGEWAEREETYYGSSNGREVFSQHSYSC